MSERTVRRDEDHELGFVSGPELDRYLDSIVSSIGWIVVYFNSLEDHVSDFIREVVLRDPFQDERLEPFLCEMGFSAKCRALTHLYGQMLGIRQVKYTHDDLKALESTLMECASRRNEYAHADWIGVREKNFVRVKSQSRKTGVVHRYRKFDIARLNEDIEFINGARFRLNEFHDNLQDQFWGRA
jgi:hypothetical protein